MIYFLATILALLPTYLIRFHIEPLPTTLLELLVVVFLLMTGYGIRDTGYKKIKNLGRINYAIGLFVLAGIISTIISADHMKALGQLKAFIIEPVLMFYAAVLTIKSEEQLANILRFLFCSAAILAGLGIIQYVTLIHLPLRFWGNGEEVRRIVSMFEYPNALSLYLAPLLGLFFSLTVSNYQLFKSKWIPWGGMGVMGLALLLTFSRGAWVALVAALLLLLMNKYGLKKITIPAFVVLLLTAFIPSVNQRLTLGLSDPSSSAHLNLIKTGWHQIISNPILGNGLGGFANQDLGVNYPHNIILNFWVEMGLLGLVAFAWIIYLCSQRYKKDPQPLILAASIYLLIFLLHGLVDVPYFKNDLSILFWFVAAIFYL